MSQGYYSTLLINCKYFYGIFIRLLPRNSLIDNIVFYIQFGKTQQIVVTLITATFKAFLPVTKTDRRISRRKLRAANIRYLFLAHINLHSNKKRCATEATHRKTQTPIVAKQKTNDTENTIHKLAESTFLPLFTNLCKRIQNTL